jgi:hypothetical protein
MDRCTEEYVRALQRWPQIHRCFPSWLSAEDLQSVFEQFVTRRLREAGFLNRRVAESIHHHAHRG